MMNDPAIKKTVMNVKLLSIRSEHEAVGKILLLYMN